MKQLKGKTIVLGVTGGIAAYKAAYLASSLVKAGGEVHVIMTQNAMEFVAPLTFETLTGQKCVTDTFDRNFQWNVEHVALAKRADLFVVAPATANIIAKFACGLADDMLSTTWLAASCKKLVAPAMNTGMYENPVTQRNLKALEELGVSLVEPGVGRLACADVGRGRLAEPEEIFERICFLLHEKQDLVGKRVLVTAGPTQEALDPVRYITNHSSGKMGFAVARRAALRGAQVTLVAGPVALPTPQGVCRVDVRSALEMFEEVKARMEEADIVVKTAAVGDFRPETTARDKIKKAGEDTMEVRLVKNPDILRYVGEHKRPGQIVCGFSMETRDLLENSAKKLNAKNADMIVANSLSEAGAGFGVDTNIVTLLTKEGAERLPLMEKEELADVILDRLLAL
ncbi:bifunctional phosphopantothenoylcysteine decarboxylase/phosphopantothenate--cysteine ligase CoaBC [Zongyangia hominis]|uniref:Coenzyme A biosynthesis bifunctional protein CoaBC n=1 Tax=Zongyangia hominis TaxID=2763677 RepID=A0A926IC31_9FIRM|nr:bifunctional phosphopantothenoylcysteine decarboxylase/phosphopantothenate--cysteine ligase CoaBC [Zongyangia hominis]MBC8570918.1 bifunctional phosphopantothenoylcysteine decarboxylase/phosphopantothenate--cysteine ligase CoaBC [Zongyangia hominis]